MLLMNSLQLDTTYRTNSFLQHEGNLCIEDPKKASTLQAAWYRDESIYAIERAGIFRHFWQYIGPSGLTKEAGSFLTTAIDGLQLVVVRGHDGVLRGFHNICRHRGGPIAKPPQDGHSLHFGKTKLLTCQYHGWSYALDGNLAAASHMQEAEDFAPKDCRLPQVAVKEWYGFIFVNLDLAAAPFTDHVAGIAETVERDMKFTERFFKRFEYDVDANWKIYCDNYLEGYHVPFLHPELTDVLEFQKYTTTVFDHYSLQSSPIEGADNAYSTAGPVHYYFVTPNIMLNILPGRIQVNSVIPISVNKTRVIFDYYFDDTSNLKKIGKDIEFSELVQAQDADMCAYIQKSMESGSYESGRIAPQQEVAVHHFQNFVRSTIKKFSEKITSVKANSL